MAKKKSPAKKNVKKIVKKATPKKAVVKKAKKSLKKKVAAPQKTAAKVKNIKKTVKKAPANKKVQAKAKMFATKTNKKAVAKKAVAPKVVAKKTAPVAKVVNAKSNADYSSLMTPLDDRILVRLFGAEKKTAGGLYIPDTVSDVSGNLEGSVVAIGRGRMNKKGHIRPMDVCVGDRVVFSEYSGSKVKIQNEELVILREEDVMGVVSK